NDARGGFTQYHRRARLSGQIAAAGAMGDPARRHSRSRSRQVGQRVALPPNPFAIANAIGGLGIQRWRLPPDSDALVIQRYPWRYAGDFVGCDLTALVK